MLEKASLFGLAINTGSFESFTEEIFELSRQNTGAVVCVANVHMFMEATNDEQLMRIINTADLVTPDGKPLCWALQFLNGIKQDRVAGMDLLPELLLKAEEQKTRIFFYGGTPEMLEKTRGYMKMYYPAVSVVGYYSPPFRLLTGEEENNIIEMINRSGANLVFVVLGCPKQEKWMDAVRKRVNAVMIGVGGALPVMIGMQKRAPRWMQRYGLEWLYRLGQEPRRLFKRYAKTNSKFILLLLKEKFSSTKK